MLLKYDNVVPVPPSLQTLLTERDHTIQLLKANLHRAQQVMKHYADTKRKFVEFKVGDMVLVKLQPYRQHSLSLHQNQKLGLRYFGPFPILERIGVVAYKVLLPPSAKIHPVFHIANLKLCKGNHSNQYMPLPLLTTETGPILCPETILDSRVLLQQGKEVPQVLVQWFNLSAAEATWENWSEFSSNYPNFNLEDKVNFNGGSNVMNKDKRGNKSQQNNQHVAYDPQIQELGRGVRSKIPNRKYTTDFI